MVPREIIHGIQQIEVDDCGMSAVNSVKQRVHEFEKDYVNHPSVSIIDSLDDHDR